MKLLIPFLFLLLVNTTVFAQDFYVGGGVGVGTFAPSQFLKEQTFNIEFEAKFFVAFDNMAIGFGLIQKQFPNFDYLGHQAKISFSNFGVEVIGYRGDYIKLLYGVGLEYPIGITDNEYHTDDPNFLDVSVSKKRFPIPVLNAGVALGRNHELFLSYKYYVYANNYSFLVPANSDVYGVETVRIGSLQMTYRYCRKGVGD